MSFHIQDSAAVALPQDFMELRSAAQWMRLTGRLSLVLACMGLAVAFFGQLGGLLAAFVSLIVALWTLDAAGSLERAMRDGESLSFEIQQMAGSLTRLFRLGAVLAVGAIALLMAYGTVGLP